MADKKWMRFLVTPIGETVAWVNPDDLDDVLSSKECFDVGSFTQIMAGPQGIMLRQLGESVTINRQHIAAYWMVTEDSLIQELARLWGRSKIVVAKKPIQQGRIIKP